MKFNNFSIKKQFKLITLCICLLVFILSFISLYFVHQVLIKKNSMYVEDISQKTQADITHSFEQTAAITTTLIFDPDLERLLKNPYTANTVEQINNLNRKFDFFSNMTPELVSISVCSPDIIWSNFFDKQTADNLRKKMNNTTGLQSLGLIKSPLTTQSAPHNYCILFAQNIYGTSDPDSYGQNLGTLFICLNPRLLVPYEHENYILLSDTSEKYCLLNGNRKEENFIYESYKNRQKTLFYKNFLVSDNYIFNTTSIPHTNYQLIVAYDRTSLEETLFQTGLLLFMIIFLSCGVILLLLYLLLNNMIVPLGKIASHMNKISSSTDYYVDNSFQVQGCSEIRTLNETFCKMLSERKKLTEQLYQATVNLYETKLQKKEAELKYLRSQVNPHFLYNTLESIKNLALSHRVPQIADVTESLSQLLRYNVKGKQLVPLEQEVSIISAYLNIQNARFGKSLQIIYSILDDTKELMVMKFLLQPIIENSILHGFSGGGNYGTLFIASHCLQNKLLITIQDDGKGMSSEELHKLHTILQKNPSETSSEENHLGLSNVHYRIQLAYGAEYGLAIDSEQNEGTRITLSLPIIKSKKEDF